MISEKCGPILNNMSGGVVISKFSPEMSHAHGHWPLISRVVQKYDQPIILALWIIYNGIGYLNKETLPE